ncbi:MAG TPA: transcription elongation factor GreB [Labilithrix sp.]|jgi:transcription elongation factor GreB
MKGDPHYMTPEGAKRLQAELAELLGKTRRKIVQEVADAAAQGDRSENAEYIYGKKKLREIDRRIHFLTKRLESTTVVDPSARPEGERDRVFFGATIEIEDEDGKRASYQIVGEDEIDLTRGRISYKSPLARTLMKKREGETVLFRKPSGEIELTILAVRYGDALI